jgi:hypothetical protein
MNPDGTTEYLRELDLTITGVTAGEPGLTLIEDEFDPEIMPGIAEQRLPG